MLLFVSFLVTFFGLKVTENPIETDLYTKENIFTSITENSAVRVGFDYFRPWIQGFH